MSLAGRQATMGKNQHERPDLALKYDVPEYASEETLNSLRNQTVNRYPIEIDALNPAINGHTVLDCTVANDQAEFWVIELCEDT